jgi:hypothetical protein
MIPEDALQEVLSRLDQCGISHMITGSFASNMHGVPRATQDAGIVIEANQGSLNEFLESLGAEFYASLSPSSNRDRSSARYCRAILWDVNAAGQSPRKSEAGDGPLQYDPYLRRARLMARTFSGLQ